MDLALESRVQNLGRWHVVTELATRAYSCAMFRASVESRSRISECTTLSVLLGPLVSGETVFAAESCSGTTVDTGYIRKNKFRVVWAGFAVEYGLFKVIVVSIEYMET